MKTALRADVVKASARVGSVAYGMTGPWFAEQGCPEGGWAGSVNHEAGGADLERVRASKVPKKQPMAGLGIWYQRTNARQNILASTLVSADHVWETRYGTSRF